MKRGTYVLFASAMVAAIAWCRHDDPEPAAPGWEIQQHGVLRSLGRRGLPETIEHRAVNTSSADRTLVVTVGGDCDEIALRVTDDAGRDIFYGPRCEPLRLTVPGGRDLRVSLTGRRVSFDLALRLF